VTGHGARSTVHRMEGRVTRRQFVRFGTLAVLVPAALVEACGGAHRMTLDQALRLDDRPKTLDHEQLTTLEAVLERLIPSDGNGPGAREAKVWRYIDHALAHDLAPAKQMYTDNLPALDRYASMTRGAAFAKLPADRQDDVLRHVEAGKAAGFRPDSSAFFTTVLAHAQQGMFGDPVYGGNADFTGWDLIGFPGIYAIVPAEWQRFGIEVPTAHRSVAQFDGMFRVPHEVAQFDLDLPDNTSR
jgi:gluconate 2-dehydrogenase gamma chain